MYCTSNFQNKKLWCVNYFDLFLKLFVKGFHKCILILRLWFFKIHNNYKTILLNKQKQKNKHLMGQNIAVWATWDGYITSTHAFG